MRNDGAEDTSEIARSEGDSQLGGLGVVLLACSKDIVVEELHEPFEGDELDDGVWHLPGPEGTQTLIESVGSCM